MYYTELSNLGIRLRRRSGQEKTTCPKCSEGRRNKKDPCLSVNITEGSYCCHNCDWKGSVKVYAPLNQKKKFEKPDQNMLKSILLGEKIVDFAAKRGISKQTLEKFFIHGKSIWMPQTGQNENCIVFPYLRNGQIVNAKYRDGRKNFRMEKGAELILFGMQTLENRHCALLVEGEFDTLAAYEAGFGHDLQADTDGVLVEDEYARWAVLSVPNGASKGNQQMEYLDNCADWLSGIDEFIIATDNDEPGRNLKNELIRRLGVEKCRIVDWDILNSYQSKSGENINCKDLNEVLVHYGVDVVRSLLVGSNAIPVEGVYYLSGIKSEMLENFKRGIQLSPTTRFKEMDEFFRWKKGDVVLTTGYGNHGKTYFKLQIMLTKSIWDGWKWGVFCPENFPPNDFYDDLVEMYVGKPLSEILEDEYVAACEFIGEHFFYVYPEDEHDVNAIHEKFKYLILKKGLDGVMIDPFNQLDSLQKAYQREDQYISMVLKDIKRFALLYQVVYCIIAHPKNPSYKEDKSLPVVDMYDIAGGAMWVNKVDEIISYYRPNFHLNKNDPQVEIHIQKLKRKRTGGKLGSFPLTLNWQRKRYMQDDGTMPCDPVFAARELKRLGDGTQQNLALPEKTQENILLDQKGYVPYTDLDNDGGIGF